MVSICKQQKQTLIDLTRKFTNKKNIEYIMNLADRIMYSGVNC